MHIVHPYALLMLLLLAPAAFLLFFLSSAAQNPLARLGNLEILERISSLHRGRRKIKNILLIASLFFIILALSRPQFGTRLVEINQSGADIVIAVDVSSSMLAGDIRPNRLERAKTALAALAQPLGGNRVGVIAFAGTAFWQCPLTLDISGVSLFLDILDANLIPLPGTSLGSAIRLASAGLSKTAPKSKAIVLLTDGEDHNSDPLGAAREAAAQGIKIYTIGFGNPAGEPIPLYDEKNSFSGYKKNKKGEVVMSVLDEATLSKIAAETGGEYFPARDGNIDLGRLIGSIQELEKSRLSSNINRRYEDRFQIFLFIGLALLLAEFIIPETKKAKI